jgi:hypothetical protein
MNKQHLKNTIKQTFNHLDFLVWIIKLTLEDKYTSNWGEKNSKICSNTQIK